MEQYIPVRSPNLYYAIGLRVCFGGASFFLFPSANCFALGHCPRGSLDVECRADTNTLRSGVMRECAASLLLRRQVRRMSPSLFLPAIFRLLFRKVAPTERLSAHDVLRLVSARRENLSAGSLAGMPQPRSPISIIGVPKVETDKRRSAVERYRLNRNE